MLASSDKDRFAIILLTHNTLTINQVSTLFTALALAIQPCAAQSRQPRPAAVDHERHAPRVDPVRVQAAALTSYFADRLRLQARQQPAVRHCV